MISCGICLYLSDLLHLVWESLVTSVLLQKPLFCYFFWLSSIPLCICTTHIFPLFWEWCQLWVCHKWLLLYWGCSPFCPLSGEFLSGMGVDFFKSFFCILEITIWFLFFSLLMWCVYIYICVCVCVCVYVCIYIYAHYWAYAQTKHSFRVFFFPT